MIIIIDGYNLLRFIFPKKEKGKLQSQREKLLKLLAFYKTKKGHSIIIVFDGGLERRATRETHKGIVVVFSGQKVNADDWIVQHVINHSSDSFLLVTNDRELINKTKSPHVDVINVEYFYTIISSYTYEQAAPLLEDGSLKKFKHEDEEEFYDQKELDMLMMRVSMGGYEEESSSSTHRLKGDKIPKKNRQQEKKIKKL